MGVFAAFSGGKIFSGFPGFSAPADRGARTALAGSPLTGGSFSAPESRGRELRRRVRPFRRRVFAEPQRGIRRLRTAGTSPRRRGARKGHLRFSFLFELYLSLALIRRRFPTCDRFEKEYGSRFFFRVFLHLFAVHRQRSATQIGDSAQARHMPRIFYCALYRVEPTTINCTVCKFICRRITVRGAALLCPL